MPAPTQEDRVITIQTPLGDDILLLQHFAGTEALSKPFEYQLDLLSESFAIDFNSIVGQKVCVTLDVGEDAYRYFNGHVSRFVQTGRFAEKYARYRAVVVPWLWFLTRTANCRVFQGKTVPDIVKSIFGDHGFADFEYHLTLADYPAREYCVQYRESDFSFISRLLEEEGIYYYFRHGQSAHTLVLCDSPSRHDVFAGYAEIPFDDEPSGQNIDVAEHISAWQIEQAVQSGAFGHTDFNFTTPDLNLAKSTKMPGEHVHSNLEVYDYPGGYGDGATGERYARIRMEELAAAHDRCSGQGDVRGIVPGCVFNLAGHHRDDQNRAFLVTSAGYEGHAERYAEKSGDDPPKAAFSCSFAAIPSDRQYRPARTTPRPVVQGPQTAIVRNDGNQKVQVDEHGRVRVNFHWDREAETTQHNSCWVRVSQHWAGNKFGTMMIPHDGQEVIVAFLEGDPDRPIITGRVYNQKNMPPGSLPEDKDKTVVARDDYGNEIVLDATKGDEHIRIHSPHHKSKIEVGKSVRYSSESDESKTIWGNSGEVVLGSSLGVLVGGSGSATLGTALDATAGIGISAQLGPSLDVSVGPKYSYSKGKESSNCDSSVLAVAKGDHVMHSFKGIHLSSSKDSKSDLGNVALSHDMVRLWYGEGANLPHFADDKRGKKTYVMAHASIIATLCVLFGFVAAVSGAVCLGGTEVDDDRDWIRWTGAGLMAITLALIGIAMLLLKSSSEVKPVEITKEAKQKGMIKIDNEGITLSGPEGASTIKITDKGIVFTSPPDKPVTFNVRTVARYAWGVETALEAEGSPEATQSQSPESPSPLPGLNTGPAARSPAPKSG